MPTLSPALPRAVAALPGASDAADLPASDRGDHGSDHRDHAQGQERGHDARPRTGDDARAHIGADIGTDAGAPVLGREILIQHTVLTGFRHHAAPRLWAALTPRTRLSLVREPDNPEDPRAVALYWRGQKIGYLPRGENLVVAQLLDRKRNLSARIERLRPDAQRNERIAIRVLMH